MKYLAALFLALFLATPVYASDNCSCVRYVVGLRPDAPLKDAVDYVPNSQPYKGAVAIFRYKNGVSHVAYVSSTHGSYFGIWEANYKRCQLTQRYIRYDDPTLLGFWG